MMQNGGNSKNVRCMAVKIAAFSKSMQKLLFEVIPDLTWQPEESNTADKYDDFEMVMNADDEVLKRTE